jgi:hypothetical protein
MGKKFDQCVGRSTVSVVEDTVIRKMLRSDKRDVENDEENYKLRRLINHPFHSTSLGELNRKNEKSGNGR